MFRHGKQPLLKLPRMVVQPHHVSDRYVHLVTVLIIFMSNLTQTRYKLLHSPFQEMHSPLKKVPEIHPTS